MFFNDSTVQNILDKKIQHNFQVFSFFSSKSDNKIIYDYKDNSNKLSCVILWHQKEFISNKTLSFQSEYNSCITQCPGFMGSTTHASITMRSMTIMGSLTNATIYIYNENSIYEKSGSPLIIIIDGCYYQDSTGRQIYISWFLANEPQKFKNSNVFSNFNENWYDKFTSKRMDFNAYRNDCNHLDQEHKNLCKPDQIFQDSVVHVATPVLPIVNEEFESGVTVSGFIYFCSILFAVILIFPIYYFFKEKCFKRVISRSIVSPMN